jgi:hypothetical protein
VKDFTGMEEFFHVNKKDELGYRPNLAIKESIRPDQNYFEE